MVINKIKNYNKIFNLCHFNIHFKICREPLATIPNQYFKNYKINVNSHRNELEYTYKLE